MRFAKLMTVARYTVTTALAWGSVLAASPPSPRPATAAPAAALMPAEWTPKVLMFVYKHGFTTHYSCEGLRDKMTDILTRLGAENIEIQSTGCVNLAAPDVAPGVYVRMKVLRPAHEWTIQHAVPAHWQKVDLLAGRDPVDAASDCELIAQIKQDVLPLFATRGVDYRATCETGKVLPSGTRLTAEVLVRDTNFASTPAR